jgi:hypothetical protein
MKKNKTVLIVILLMLNFITYAQVTGKTVTIINVKMENLKTIFQKFKESEWKMVQKGADGSKTELRGFNVLTADNNSITLEQKDFGANIKIDFTSKKVTALENGKPSAQKILFVSASDSAVELVKPDVFDINDAATGNSVSSIKWKNELMNDVHSFTKTGANEWSCSYEAIYKLDVSLNWTKKFKVTAADNNTITFEEINEDPSNTMFYAYKFKIDLASKVIYKAVYEADVKKWTPLEKDENGTNVFLIIK